MKNTIHCVKCGFGTDVSAEKFGKQEYNHEEFICSACGERIEVVIRPLGKEKEKPF